MLIKKSADIGYSEVTPKALYFNRRKFLAGIPAAFLGARELLSPSRARAGMKLPNLAKSPFSTPEKENSYNDVTHYNNYYEFGTGKDEPAEVRQEFQNQPVDRLRGRRSRQAAQVQHRRTHALAPLEERIYRHRCVEAWSIVVPWVGYSFSALLKQVEPTPKAKYVAFQSYYDLGQMPPARRTPASSFPTSKACAWMKPCTRWRCLTWACTARRCRRRMARRCAWWCRGSTASRASSRIVKIKLVEKQPPTTWNIANAHEYGFYSNVNPARGPSALEPGHGTAACGRSSRTAPP